MRRTLCGLTLLLVSACSSTSSSPAVGSAVPLSPVANTLSSQIFTNSATAAIQADQASSSDRFSPDVSLLPPTGEIYFGAQVNPTSSVGNLEDVTEQFEHKIGRTLALHAEYYNWRDSFPGNNEADDYAHGRVPVISWDCGAKAIDVINGLEDAVIRNHAVLFKKYRHRVFLRYFWEMNLPFVDGQRQSCVDPNRDVNGYITPSDFINAWDHIRAIFHAEGATNVAWLWCPSGFLRQDPLPYYPGSSQTAWIGFDHYDVDGTEGLLNTLSAPYAALEKLQKPMIVAETGTIQGKQYPYLSTAPSVLQNNFPRVRGFIYFDQGSTRGNWVLNAAGIAGAKVAGASPYFSAMAHLQ